MAGKGKGGIDFNLFWKTFLKDIDLLGENTIMPIVQCHSDCKRRHTCLILFISMKAEHVLPAVVQSPHPANFGEWLID